MAASDHETRPQDNGAAAMAQRTGPEKVLVTGAAGFIGFHVSKVLTARGDTVTGIDNFSDYYDVSLKKDRVEALRQAAGNAFAFETVDVADTEGTGELFARGGFDRVIHLAAQAGVRHSLTAPGDYVSANLVGFANILEGCRHSDIRHLTYASTSSVYGANTKLPFQEGDTADHPLQLYAATKRANELMAHSYSHLFALPTSGLRFFTVYGPWGRPDMALFKFTRAILAGEPIEVFNNGDHTRDFTYVDDIVRGVVDVSDRPAAPDPDFDPTRPDPATSSAPFRVLNIGNNAPAKLTAYIEALERALGRRAEKTLLPLQPGDVPDTFADVSRLEKATGFKPSTTIDEGIERFVAWYRDYYSA